MIKTTFRFLELLGHQAAGGVTEVCIFRDGDVPTHVGYFDDRDAAVKAIAQHDGGGNVFVSLNPAKPDLLARYNNRLVESSFKRKLKRTRDDEILRDSWLLIDPDPKRPSGISSSDAEMSAAVEVGAAIRDWLIGLGVPAASLVTAKSGNGCYVLVRLPDYKVTAARTALKQAFVNHVADLFSNEVVEIDRTVYNPARLVGALGTMKVKGEDIAERPHRRSFIGTVGGEKFDLEQAQRCEPFDLYALAEKILPPAETLVKKGNAAARGKTGERVFDFDIRTIRDGLANEKPTTRGYTYFDCPNCGGVQTLHVSEYTGAYSCFHVGAGTCNKQELGARLRELADVAAQPSHREAQQTKPALNGHSRSTHAVISASHNSQYSQNSARSGNSANTANCANEPEEWDLPASFNEYILPVFPIDALPAWQKAFSAGLARETQTPVDLAAMLTLAVEAGAVAGSVEVEARRGWREPLNIFAVSVLPPANRKSGVFAAVTDPLEQVEARLIEDARAEVAKAESERDILAARLEHLKREAAKDDDEKEREKKSGEAVAIAQELSKLKVLKLPRRLADDTTPETLATLLADQEGRMAIFSAEPELFDIMAGRYSNGTPNLGVFLKGHAGDRLRIDRRGRAEFIDHPALTIGLAAQNESLRGLASKPTFKGRGLLGRFLYSIPKSTLGNRKARVDALNEEARIEYTRRIKAMAGLKAGADEEGKRQARMLYLNPEADNCLAAFQDEIEPMLADGGEMAAMNDWAGKLAGAVLRLAGILHLADHAGGYTEWPEMVPEATMRRAIEIGRYLIPHAQAAYAEMGADPEIEAAKYVLRWIEKVGQASFTKREAFEATKGRFKKVEALEPALRLLAEHSYIRALLTESEPRRGRKSSQIYEVNPALLEGSHNSQDSQKQAQPSICANCATAPEEDFPDYQIIPATPVLEREVMEF